jgi:ribosomal protein L11 methyltransferase
VNPLTPALSTSGGEGEEPDARQGVSAVMWQISVVTTLEAEEAVMELLTRVFRRSAAIYTNEKTKVSMASVYCPKRSEWNNDRRAALRQGLAAVKSSGLKFGAGKILVRRVPREDWTESWKRHFKPLSIGSRLLIKPGWIKHRPGNNRAVVVLNPGLSFGTGNHPTTSFCLHELAKRRIDGTPQSFLDAGTGSGILAIAAAKLGYCPVRAIDADPQSVGVARENARINRVGGLLQIARADITRLTLRSREKYDLICANLISDLLVAERQRLLSRLRAGGTIVLAGILKTEFCRVQKVYEAAGMKLAGSRTEGEWRSGAFQRAVREGVGFLRRGFCG